MDDETADPPELRCHVKPGWRPDLEPAPVGRDWMDASPDRFAYRCLPLAIANQHGWILRNPVPFTAIWDGSKGPAGVRIAVHPTDPPSPHRPAVSIFGVGVVTWHVHGVIRTPPGWNLWVSGVPNEPKDGVCPLTGVVETDWAPMSFTANSKLTRPGFPVHWAAGEPVAFVFPVQRGAVEAFRPVILPLDADPGLRDAHDDWSAKRDEFHRVAAVGGLGPRPADHWQKHYAKGIGTLPGSRPHPGHQTKLRVRPFEEG